MNIERHLERLNESLEVIEESIKKGLVRRQRNIGFNTSAAASDMFEIYLHKQDLIDPGFVVKHEWFNSRNKVKEKFDFDFPEKEQILNLMMKIEEKRNALCYGAPKEEEMVRSLVTDFNSLKLLFKKVGINEIE